ncbi:MAG: tyrosine-protein phosphatase [Ilumatobacter sp.]|uniref:protein-tyrosine phosphatase family protein n=1 Tax=Ilumatobacter sp. TaxID=1967498 RepID=UPI002621ABB3|nr:tyrosine-protein phosphatase [Ilumatobacter sp.]MDJ0769182.1 tyrosine-protein phosphatase [Ilumatobacter sp.]
MSIDRIPLPSTTGSLWLCGRHDIAPDPEAALAWADDASTVVCLNPAAELQARFPAYVDWLRANKAGRALWFPIRNFGAESADATMPFLRMIAARLEAGEGVVMHCAMGQGRAGTMAVCLLMVLGATRDEALRTVAAHRTFAGPADSSQWRLVDEVASMVARQN